MNVFLSLNSLLQKDLPDDILDDDFLNAMKGLGMDGSEGGPEGLMSMMQGMMTNLLSKDILYPSLKEIQTKVSIVFI